MVMAMAMAMAMALALALARCGRILLRDRHREGLRGSASLQTTTSCVDGLRVSYLAEVGKKEHT